MASKSELNPNAAPFPFLKAPVVVSLGFFCYQAEPNWGYPSYPNHYQLNFNSQVNCYLPIDCGSAGKGMQIVEDGEFVNEGVTEKHNKVVKGRKVRNLPPRFRSRRNFVLGGKEKQWLPKDLTAAGTRLTKKEMEVGTSGKTSLMIRNIPNQFRRHDLQMILDNHCLVENKNNATAKSAYDFLYLPMDFKTGGNFGYAFVNFTSCVGASRFWKAFDNHKWDVTVNKKTCKICFANIQGKLALTNRFKSSVFCCSEKEYLPVVLSPPGDGVVCSTVKVIGHYRELQSRQAFME